MGVSVVGRVVGNGRVGANNGIARGGHPSV